AGVSRLQISWAVPQVARHRAHRGGRLLPRGLARGLPGPRLRPKYPCLRHHPVSNRGDLDGPLPARDRCEDRQARRAHPRRGVNAIADLRRPLSWPPPGAECRAGLPARHSMTESFCEHSRRILTSYWKCGCTAHEMRNEIKASERQSLFETKKWESKVNR